MLGGDFTRPSKFSKSKIRDEISLQEKMTKRIGVIEKEIRDKMDEIDGKPCSHCGAKRHEPNEGEL